MKNRILIYILISISTFSCKKDIAEFEPTNPFENILRVEKQVFDLDTITIKEITGKKGTRIYFNREDFDVNENDKIILELKEYYNRLELISNNLNTISDKNELLESNGVLYLNFKVDDKIVKLKRERSLKIEFAQEFRTEDRIFNGVLDSLNQITWIEDNAAYTVFPVIDDIITMNYGGVETYKDRIIPLDSLQYYKDLNTESQWWLNPPIFVKNFGWINVDKILNPDSNISYELTFNIDELDYINSFLFYKDLNSFISDYRKLDDLTFVDIPLKNETSLIIIGKKGKRFFASKRILDSKINGILKMELKETDTIKLKKLIQK